MDREVIFGDTITTNDVMTATDYGLILNSADAQPPAPRLHSAELPASDGVIDLSTALTDGEVKYSNRTLNMRFIAMHRTYEERMTAAAEMVATLHGKKLYIQLPDDTYRYYGRCTVGIERNPGYIFINVSADCEPYRYSMSEDVQTFTGDTKTERTLTENMTLKGLKLYASVDAPINIYTRSRTIGGVTLPGFIDFTNSSVVSSNYRVIELTSETDANLTVYYANNSASSAHTIAVMQNGADIAAQEVAGNGDETLTVKIKGGTAAKIYAKSGGLRIYGINLGSLSWRTTDFLKHEISEYPVLISNPIFHKTMIPELRVSAGTVSLYGDTISLTRLPAGTYKLYDFSVSGGTSQNFRIKLDAGAKAEIHSRGRKL
ncbi:MAG: hypothetical protein Q4G33_07530 [bacterium]|nr:hypothetical protein [bacterium]